MSELHENTKDCSILIPTYNRPLYLKRVLNYYNECGRDFNIFIADSSEDENKKKNKKTISSFSDMNIEYLDHYSPEHNDYLCVMQKILDMMDHVKEKYCVYCADDDFVTPVGISQSVNFLDKNPDFSVAIGSIMCFMLIDGQFYWKHPTQLHSIDDPDAKNRIFSFLSNPSAYPPPTGGVNKTDILKMLWRETLKYADDGRFGEIMMYPLSLVYGKMKCLDVFFTAREMSHFSVGNTMNRFSDFITDGTFDRRYNRIKEGLALHLSKNSSIELEEAKEIVNKGLREFFRHSEKGQLIPRINRILNNIHLSPRIDTTVRTPYRMLSRLKAKDPLDSYVTDGRFNDSPDELNRIKKWVLDKK